MKKLIFILSFLLITSFLFACGGGSSGTEEIVQEEIGVAKSTEFFGTGGNLYKPRSDESGAGQGNLVVLLDAKFTKQFDNCEVVTNTGATEQLHCINTEEWTQIPFSCFSNGNRQTWRANFRCGTMSDVKVVCRNPEREVTFVAPDHLRGSVCSRI